MENQCQHLTEVKRDGLLKVLQKTKELLYGKLGTWISEIGEFKLKENAETICSRPYLVPKLHKEMVKKRC